MPRHEPVVDSTPGDMDETFLTVKEVAGLLKVNQQTVRNWIDRGSLRVVRVGTRRVRIRESDLRRFLAESSVEGVRSLDATRRDESKESAREAGVATSLADAFRAAAEAGRPELSVALRALASAANDLADELESDICGRRARQGRAR